VSGSHALSPRWQPQCSCVVIESSFDPGERFPMGSYVKLSSAVGAILVDRPNHWTHFWKRTIQWLFHQSLVPIEQLVPDKKILCEFPIGSYAKLSSAVGAILVDRPNHRTHFWKRTIQWLFHQNLVLISSKWFQTRRFLWEFPIGSYVKLSSVVAAWNSRWMVLFQKCVRWFGLSTKMAPTAELSLT
jgi:hypothetical protein